MGFRNFRLNIIIRVLVLLAALTACAVFIATSEPIRATYTGLLVLILIIEYFYYTDKLNRDLNQFFVSILHDDFTSVFRERGKGRSFRGLYETLDEITMRFRVLSKEKEMRGQYLHSLIDQVKVGIISFEPEGVIHLVNRSFNEILGIQALRNGSNLKDLQPELFSMLESLNTGEKQLIRRKVGSEDREFSIVSAGFRMEEQYYNLVSVQDIREELDNREFEAWQKLIRVLTHEIMNSVSPIASLTGSLRDLAGSEKSSGTGKRKDDARNKVYERLVEGLKAIHDRSEGLIRFTEAYQDLARIPNPVIKEINTGSFTGRIGILFNPQFENSGIKYSTDDGRAPESFHADPELIEQVIINLVRNAVEAITGRAEPEIRLVLERRPAGKVSIKVLDNGVGIPSEMADRIFVPFFSTKEKGSGIGLSLSRQIILMHRGSLTVRSEAGKGSEFEIIL